MELRWEGATEPHPTSAFEDEDHFSISGPHGRARADLGSLDRLRESHEPNTECVHTGTVQPITNNICHGSLLQPD